MKTIRMLLCLATLSLAIGRPDASAQVNNVLPVVSIHTTFAETTEPSPNVRVRPGEFILQRAGSTNQALLVFVSFSGTATWGQDYEAPRYISIPAGVREATILVAPADDLLPERDETVIATVLGSVAGTVQNYIVDPVHNRATVVIHDNDAEGLPVVSIRGSSDVLEFCPPNADCVPLSYLLRRTGALDHPLTVFVEVGGMATPDFDYRALPRTVTFESGADTASIFSVPLDDLLYEGNESVVVTLISGLDYFVDPNLRSVTTIIHDNEQPVPPVVSLELVIREAGETLINQNAIFWAEFNVKRTGPITNDLLVLLTALEGSAVFNIDYRLEPVSSSGMVRLPAGASSVAVRLYPIDDLLVEGTETAVVKLVPPPPLAGVLVPPYSIDETRAAVTMEIRDNDTNEPNLPIVSISANDSWKTGEPCPVCFVVPGELTISRTGPTTSSLSVFVNYDGTALAGFDYRALPLVVTIPPGTNSAHLLVLGIDDLLVEGPEVLRARLQPMVTTGGYRIDEVANEALVVIGDSEAGAPSFRLDLIEPRAGARFLAGATVKISALAVWTEGEVDQPVEFLADGTVIGHSVPPIVDRVPLPGLPSVHTLFWTNPPAGEHDLTARYAATSTLSVTSPPVRISVGNLNNALPNIAIVQPPAGPHPANVPVEVVVEGRDPDGYIPQVRFFADGRKIGEVNVQFLVEPPPGQLQQFTFLWNDASAGKHALTAQATDNRGGVATSAPVLIEIGSSEPLPIVTVFARDAWAVEPATNTNINTATFRIRRSGPTNLPLVVAYSVSGTADNGTDFERLDSPATIPAGSRSALIVVRPRPDTQREGLETVILRLEQANAAGNYIIGRWSSAIALISDGPLPAGWPRCAVLPGGLVHLCFAAEPERNLRLETTSDLQTWETIDNALSSDATWHFVESETDQLRRFYRLTSEPVVEPE